MKIIQIVADDHKIYGLSEEGKVYKKEVNMYSHKNEWVLHIENLTDDQRTQ